MRCWLLLKCILLDGMSAHTLLASPGQTSRPCELFLKGVYLVCLYFELLCACWCYFLLLHSVVPFLDFGFELGDPFFSAFAQVVGNLGFIDGIGENALFRILQFAFQAIRRSLR
jgi:hypothetical protein